MESEEAKELVRQLAYDWFRVALPTQQLTYIDYVNAIAGLNLVTEDPDRTAIIFTALINQAKALGRSSEWVQAELKFEARVEAVGDRANWMRLDVMATEGTDASLDLYNERLTRFLNRCLQILPIQLIRLTCHC